MITEDKEFSLADHAQAVEMFNLAAQKVFKNILDPNTGDQARSVTLTMQFKPDPDTGMISSEVSVNKKLAAQKSYREKMIIGFENGKYVARRIKQQQPSLPLGQVQSMKGDGE